jgi:hypothetical protein
MIVQIYIPTLKSQVKRSLILLRQPARLLLRSGRQAARQLLAGIAPACCYAVAGRNLGLRIAYAKAINGNIKSEIVNPKSEIFNCIIFPDHHLKNKKQAV